MNDVKHDLTSAAWRGGPPLAVASYDAANGFTLNQWVMIATLIYIIMQAAYLVFKFVREWKASRTPAVPIGRLPQDE